MTSLPCVSHGYSLSQQDWYTLHQYNDTLLHSNTFYGFNWGNSSCYPRHSIHDRLPLIRFYKFAVTLRSSLIQSCMAIHSNSSQETQGKSIPICCGHTLSQSFAFLRYTPLESPETNLDQNSNPRDEAIRGTLKIQLGTLRQLLATYMYVQTQAHHTIHT